MPHPSIEFVVHTEPTQVGASYRQLSRIARTAEELGFDGFFRSDHYLQFGSPRHPAASSDAWTSLAGLARDTSRVALGTLVSPVTFRSPAQLAVQVAQVQDMSGGRAEVGLGSGWFAAEHAAFGLDFPDRRGALLEEAVEIVDGLWGTGADSTYDFAGDRYTLVGAPSGPALATRPRMILGGVGGPRGLSLAARYADEYNVPFAAPADVARIGSELQALVRAKRPGGAAVPMVSVLQTVCCGRDESQLAHRRAALGEDVKEHSWYGTPQQLLDRIGAYRDAGVGRVYFRTLDIDDLDQLALIAQDVLPYV